MKKRLMIGAMLMTLVLILAACGCDHEWMAATCTTAKTCQLCNEVEGEALSHTWQEVTCETAKTCSSCNLTEGEALGHDWQEATTDAPKTCNRCQLTEGKKIDTDPRFTTNATQHLQGTWNCEFNMTAEMMGLPMGFADGVDCIMTVEFGNAGDLTVEMTLQDEEAFKEDYREYTLEYTYLVLEQQGVSREDADDAVLQAYGLDIEDYVDAVLQSIDMGSMFEAFNYKEVYYVENDKIYTALSWNSKLFEDSAYTLENGILTVDAMTMEEGGEPLQWEKAE